MSESSAKYKVGDEVLYAGERCIVSGVKIEYSIDNASGDLLAIQIPESMLDPAEEAGND